MQAVRRVGSALALVGLVVVVVWNLAAPLPPRGSPPVHFEALHAQTSDDLALLASHHSNGKIRYYYGSFLAIGRATGGGTLAAPPDLLGTPHALLGLAGLDVRDVDGQAPTIGSAELARLLDHPHTRGVLADGDPDKVDTSRPWIAIHPDEPTDDTWRAVVADSTVVIAPESLLQRVGVAWD